MSMAVICAGTSPARGLQGAVIYPSARRNRWWNFTPAIETWLLKTGCRHHLDEHAWVRAMPVLRSERRASIERSSPYRRPRAAGVPSTPPAARTSAVAPSTRAGTGAGTGARELVERFVQWQQPHAWKQLDGVERLWATSDLHVEHESNLAFLSGLDGYSEDGLIVAGDVCQHGQKRPHVGFFSWPTRPSRRLRPAAALPT